MSKTTNYELEKYDDNTNCDFRFINGSLDKIDTELKKVSDKANKREIIIKNITIPITPFSLTVAGYQVEIKDSDVTINDVVDINISGRDIYDGNI